MGEMPAAGAAAYRLQPGAPLTTPLCRLAQDVALLSGWRRYGLAFLLGVLLAGALPPVDLAPLIFIAFPGLLWLDDGSAGVWGSARLGYVFGLGFFVAGLYWIAGALFVDIATFWWVLPFAVFGVPAFMAVFAAAALATARLAVVRLGASPPARICVFTAAWCATEWLRGHILTGFPWNLIGYVWSGGFPGALAVLQSTAWVGIYGLSLLSVLAAALLALQGAPSVAPAAAWRRWLPTSVAAMLILLPALAGALHLASAPTALTGTWLRLVQPSISETLKWKPAAAEENFRRLMQLSSAPADHPLAAVLWPEAAATFFLDRDAAHRNALAAAAPKDGYVVTGALRANPPPLPPQQVWNSVQTIDPKGAIPASYDKAHLVPFGEYVPWRDWLPIKKITHGTIDLSAGPGPQTIALPGLPAFSPLICYEVIFPAAVIDRQARPEWLLNVTNDAWYGRSSGPYQHFAIARTRAVEEGIPLVRVANNGISGMIDARGRVLARTGLDDVTYADLALPTAAAPTLYSHLGDWIFAAVLLLLAAVPIVQRVR